MGAVLTSSSTTRFDLEDFISAGEIQDRVSQGRYLIAGVFARARNPHTKRGSYNCIMGVALKLGELCQYVIDRSSRRNPLFSKEDIPPAIRSRLGLRQVHDIVQAMNRQVVMRSLLGMRDAHEIYPLDGDWMIIQSVSDESIKERERTHRIKRDDRSFHGRPKRDRYRSLVPVT